MRIRDPEDKRRRLLEAARAEFAAHGISGARMDRIAKAAGTSSGLLYAYFDNKDKLFESVFDIVGQLTAEEIPFDAADLADFGGRMFDAEQEHPDIARLVIWFHLEHEDKANTIPAVETATRAKVEAIRTAQQRGLVTTEFDAKEILLLVLTLSAQPRGADITNLADANPVNRREIVMRAIRRLVEP